MSRVAAGLCLLLFAQLPLRGADQAGAVLGTAAEVRRLSRAEATAGRAVRLEAVVTYSDPGWSLLFVRDSSAGIFLTVSSGPYPTNSELIEITGRTADGSFSPVIGLTSWRHLGDGILPNPRQLSASERSPGSFDCEWTRLVGVVQHAETTPDGEHVQMDVSSGPWRARLFVPLADKRGAGAWLGMLDARIEAMGVFGVDYADESGALSLKAFIPDSSSIRILEPPPEQPLQTPLISLAEALGKSSNAPIHRVHLRGLVTYSDQDAGLVVQQDQSAIRVLMASNQVFRVGDSVEVLGFLRQGTFSPYLENALVCISTGARPVEAASVAAGKVLWGDYDARLVQLVGTVQNYTPGAKNGFVTLLEGGVLFGVSLGSDSAAAWPDLRPGTRVRVTGVCQVRGAQRGAPQSFQVLLRRTDDLESLPPARMFSAQQVLSMIAATAGAGTLLLLWGVTLKRKVSSQTRELAKSLSLLNATIESTADGILVVDLAGKITSCNSTFVKMWGVPRDLLGTGDDARLLAFVRTQIKDAKAFSDKIKQVYTNPSSESFDTIELNDGRIFERFSQAQRLGAECVGRVWCFRDVTARKRAESELAHERDLLNILLATVPDAIYFKDCQSRFVRYSRSCAKTFGLSDPQSVKGKTDFDLFEEEHARSTYAEEQEIISTGKAVIGKLEQELHLDGRITWSLISKLPWRGEEGKIVGVFGVSTDVTSLKQAEERFELVQQQLIEASRRAGMAEVATSVLHNVGNVLNSLNVSATLIEDRLQRSRVNALTPAAELIQLNMADLDVFLKLDPKGQRFREYLVDLSTALLRENDGIVTEIKSLRENVEHIKTIVAMQQSHARLTSTVEWLDPRELMETAARINSGLFQADQIELVRDYQAMPPVPLDRHKVLQILINLLSNARHALANIPRSDRRIVLSIFSHRAESVSLRVADNGRGIEPSCLKRVFTQGFTTRQDGHGFGLHSCANAAREMSGSLSVQSDGAGKGAAFTLELPLRGETSAKPE